MKVVSNIRMIMAKKNIDNISDLVRITGVSRNSINKLWHNENVSSLKLETLITICEKLDVELLDLIEYIRDDSETK
ncbi:MULTISPECIES: helix-turn-helix domain-containing protein [Bacillus cereus group]|uniref:Transcriptional regulator n=2 Tax=Bacteria TaxID=2 RepID=A0A9W4A9G2_BACTO|nr:MULTISPECIES: helix-turn-helix transcriptional regulator [Bacteria]MBD2783012.1 helix-turn-helix transcriptional regulator [Xenorhabdus sp. 38]MBD2794485.1 helix-turn-helix transcriptional regulator [Xenorhabdus sp. CUL]MBD2806975.1 helix-turn-helix transcriptional regulator [Xenorhabdus sp. ZM]MBD2812954.1 helix-turn-helix transcriptional regulator [Xenorhabdus sp. Vera]MBD2827249.1 helix-turn-helix transcriptional regulator [Xenorhabdus sp. 5]